MLEPPDMTDILHAGDARAAAMQWQHWMGEVTMTWGELADWQDQFVALADRFPELADEFRENGII